VQEEKNRAQEASSFQLRKFSYVDRGFYAEQIERVFQYFPREQVHVIKFGQSPYLKLLEGSAETFFVRSRSSANRRANQIR